MYDQLNRAIALQILLLMEMGIVEVGIELNGYTILFRKNSGGNLVAYNDDNEIYFYSIELGWYGV